MFSWGRSKQPDHRYFIVLDIGTTKTVALLVYVENNEVCVAGRGIAKHLVDSMRGGMIIDLDAVTKTAREAIDQAVLGMGFVPKELILGVNGQLVEGVTTTIHYDRVHPDHPLEHSELKNIIYKIQHRSEEKLRESLREKFIDQHPDIELIHAAVVEAQLDGYVVENPVGFQGKRLSLTVFNAYLPLVYTSVLQSLAKNLGLNLISLATQPYGLSKLLINSPKDQDIDAVFIDVGGHSTDVVIVKNGSVEGMQNFSLGGLAFTRSIKRHLKLSFEKAESIKREYSEQTLDKKTTDKISEAIEEDILLWRTGVEMALRELPDTKTLPTKIFLTGGGSPLPDLIPALQEKIWYQDLPFSARPTVSVVNADDVGLVVDEPGLDWGPENIPPLGLAKLILDLTPEEDIVATTLQTIVRAMRHK